MTVGDQRAACARCCRTARVQRTRDARAGSCRRAHPSACSRRFATSCAVEEGFSGFFSHIYRGAHGVRRRLGATLFRRVSGEIFREPDEFAFAARRHRPPPTPIWKRPPSCRCWIRQPRLRLRLPRRRMAPPTPGRHCHSCGPRTSGISRRSSRRCPPSCAARSSCCTTRATGCANWSASARRPAPASPPRSSVPRRARPPRHAWRRARRARRRSSPSSPRRASPLNSRRPDSSQNLPTCAVAATAPPRRCSQLRAAAEQRAAQLDAELVRLRAAAMQHTSQFSELTQGARGRGAPPQRARCTAERRVRRAGRVSARAAELQQRVERSGEGRRRRAAAHPEERGGARAARACACRPHRRRHARPARRARACDEPTSSRCTTLGTRRSVFEELVTDLHAEAQVRESGSGEAGT